MTFYPQERPADRPPAGASCTTRPAPGRHAPRVSTMTHSRSRFAAIAAATLLTAAAVGPLHAAPKAQALFARTGAVEGLPGWTWGGTLSFSISLGTPTISPDGMNWGIGALLLDNGGNAQRAVLYGNADGIQQSIISGTTSGTIAIDDPFVTPGDPSIDRGIAYLPATSAVDVVVGAGNDGDFAFRFQSTEDFPSRYLIRKRDGAYTVLAGEGYASPIPDAFYGTSYGNIQTLADGSVSFTAGNMFPAINSGSAFVAPPGGPTAVLVRNQDAASTPATTLGVASPWASINTLSYAGDGSAYLMVGDVGGSTSTNGVVAVDNQVVVREGFAVPGITTALAVKSGTAPFVAQMTHAGDTLIAGQWTDNRSFLLKNGDVIAQSGLDLSILRGGQPNEFIDDPTINPRPFGSNNGQDFLALAGNNNGDFAYITLAGTAGVDPSRVLVYNNTHVLARTGSLVFVDFNNDGVDEPAYISVVGTSNAGRLLVGDDGYAYFGATLRTAPDGGTTLGDAWLKMLLPTIDGDVDRDWDVDFDDLGLLLGGYDDITEQRADFDYDDIVDFDDLGLLLGNYGFGVAGVVTGELDASAIQLLVAAGFGAVVPEPGASALAAPAALLLARRRRR